MRYVEILVKRDPAHMHPITRALEAEPELRREAIHQMKLLDDGTVALLGEVTGNLDRYRELMADQESVVDYTISGEDHGFAYCQFEPNELTERLLQYRTEQEFMIQMPIEITDEGHQRMTLVGDEAVFTEHMATPDPEGVELEVLRTGEYDPDVGHLLDLLTQRQREILETALELGYYDQPRDANQADVAEALDLSPATVGDHLRKVEARVFNELVV